MPIIFYNKKKRSFICGIKSHLFTEVLWVWVTKIFAHVFPSRKMCPTRKLMPLVSLIQLFHLFLIRQGAINAYLKAWTTKTEPHSSHNFLQPFTWAISIGKMAAISSAKKAIWPPRKLALWSEISFHSQNHIWTNRRKWW